MNIKVIEGLYDTTTLRLITDDAKRMMSDGAKINKVGNKFAESGLKDTITKPFEVFDCHGWYVAYFEHVTAVYPHTDNDDPNMKMVAIVPLYWDTAEIPHTVIHNESSDTKQILKVRDSVTDDFDYEWKLNSAVAFPANRFHSSDQFQGMKAGIQIIGYG